MIRFIGMDAHIKSARTCIRDSKDHVLAEHNLGCTRDELKEFAQRHLLKEDILALEATFHTWSIVDVLSPYVGKILVSNPLATKAIAQSKVKTDKVDARVISQLLRCDYLPEVWIPDPETREMRGLCARRATLVSDMVRLKNRIHGVIAKALIQKPEGDLFDRKGRAWLAAQDLPENQARQISSDLRFLALAEGELEEHDRLIVKRAWSDPRVKLLITLPGVDVIVAMTVLAALGDITRFQSGDRAAAYLGLVPSTRQSGAHCYHGPITKHGNAKARWLLIQAAQHVAKHPGPLGVFFRRLAKSKGRNVAVVATARKLALIAWHMLVNNEPYRYAQPRPTQNKLARFRVRATAAKRKTGPPKGQPLAANYGSGKRSRTFPSLPELYEQEDLPPARSPSSLKAGERRMLREVQAEGFVDSLQHPSRETRSKRKDHTPDGPANSDHVEELHRK